MKEQEQEQLNKALEGTTVEAFRRLSKAIGQMGCSSEDVVKAAQEFGKALNTVPPYNYKRTSHRDIIGWFWLFCIIFCGYILLIIWL